MGPKDGSLDTVPVGRLFGMVLSAIVETTLGFSDAATLGLVLGLLEGDTVGNGVAGRDSDAVGSNDGLVDAESEGRVLGVAVLGLVGTALGSSEMAMVVVGLGLPEGDTVVDVVGFNDDGDAVGSLFSPFDVEMVERLLGMVVLAIAGTPVGSSEEAMLGLALWLVVGDILGGFVATKVGN